MERQSPKVTPQTGKPHSLLKTMTATKLSDKKTVQGNPGKQKKKLIYSQRRFESKYEEEQGYTIMLSHFILSNGKERIYLVCRNNALGQCENNANARDCKPHSYRNVLVQRLAALPDPRVVAAVVPRHRQVRERKLEDKVRKARSGLWR